MQQAVWVDLTGGLFLQMTFVQCCIDIFKYNFVVFPHMKITQCTCTIGMTEIVHDSHLNLFQGTMLRNKPYMIGSIVYM